MTIGQLTIANAQLVEVNEKLTAQLQAANAKVLELGAAKPKRKKK